VDGAAGNENESSHARRVRRLKQPQRTHEIGFEECFEIVVATDTKAAASLPLQGGMNHGIDTANQRSRRRPVVETTGQPFDGVRDIVETTAITAGAIPAA